MDEPRISDERLKRLLHEECADEGNDLAWDLRDARVRCEELATELVEAYEQRDVGAVAALWDALDQLARSGILMGTRWERPIVDLIANTAAAVEAYRQRVREEAFEEAKVFADKTGPLMAAALKIESFSPFDPARGLPRGFIAAINALNDATNAIREFRAAVLAQQEPK